MRMETKIRERALVVDDNPAALFAVSALIQGMCFEVDEANGPLAAIALYEARSYDLVVSDIHMPGGIDGIQLGRIIRRKNAAQAIILMTGHAEHLNAGAGEFIILAKPFESADLRKALKQQKKAF